MPNIETKNAKKIICLCASAYLLFLSQIVSCQSKKNIQRLEVYAAGSLTDAFLALEDEFERKHENVDISLNLAGSQILRLQIENGASADVFASANPQHIHALYEANLVETPQFFARNTLVVAVPNENPSNIQSFQDLQNASRIVIGTEDVPIGRYTRTVLQNAEQLYGPFFQEEVFERVVSEENNVRLVRAKIELGEADAGIIFRTDALNVHSITMFSLPTELEVHAQYTITRVTESRHQELADEWIKFVLSEEGQTILQNYGFISPSG